MTEPAGCTVLGIRYLDRIFDALERAEPHLKRDEEGFLGAFDPHRDLIFQTAEEVHSQERKSRYDLVGTDFR